MCDGVSFGDYMAMCGWTGDEEADLYYAMSALWATREYYGTWKTVERLLCSPDTATRFVYDFATKIGLSHAQAILVDKYTVLYELLNRLRKTGALDSFETGYDNK